MYDLVYTPIDNSDESLAEFAKFASDIWHEYWHNKISLNQIEYMLNKFQSPPVIKELMENEEHKYMYIISDGQKAGYIVLADKPDCLFLSKIYISKLFRHRGIGTKAFEYIKSIAKAQGYGKIVLTVKRDNKHSFDAYIKWGFKVIDSVNTDIGCGFVMDDYVMEYELA